MTILHAGGELSAFTPTGSVTEVTTAGTFNSTYARSAISVSNQTSYFDTPTHANTTDYWCHFEAKLSNFGSAVADCIQWFNGSGTNVVRLRNSSSGSNVWRLEVWDGSAWQAGTSPTSLDYTNLQTWDVHIVVGATTTATLFQSGSQVATTGAITTSAVTNIASARFRHSQTGGSLNWSQIICADESTVGMKLATMYPNANSATNTAWTGDFNAVDEATTFDDTDFISSTSAGDVETYGCTDATIGSLDIKALVVTARAKKGATGPQNLQAALRIGGTNYFSSNLSNVSSGFGPVVGIFATDPSTGSIWGATNLNAAEIGVKSIA
jgi:hypothetical protein